MAKSVHNDVLDGMLNVINDATVLTICSAQPTTYAEATSTYKLADVVIDASDFTIADGDVSGRKITIASQTAIPIDTTGTANHVALCDGSRLLEVTTCTSQALTAGGSVTTPAWDIEVADPV